nr:MAG: ORF1 [TTV-like mini virus]
MPWNWYRRGYYQRRRRLWRRRPRGFVRRRLWRRRNRRFYKRRVRRKLPFLRLKQWQPHYINKLKVTTTMPLYITTKDRIDHNSTLYLDVPAPHSVPSLGGFSINVFTLNNLYNLYLQGRAWWTRSNNEAPLIRYLGCTATIFRPESSDLIFKWHNCFPMTVSAEAYNATQPSIMLISKKHKTIRCKKHNFLKKPYTKVHIKPPAQLSNKWYFQKDLADTPLVMTFAAATSLDRYFIASNSQSTTIGFYGLDTSLITYHDFRQQTTLGYHPSQTLYLWSFQQGQTPKPTLETLEAQNLIFLGQSQKKQMGNTIKDAKQQTEDLTTKWNDIKTRYSSSAEYWGNLFEPPYLTGKYDVLHTTDPLRTTLSKMTSPTTKANQLNLHYFVQPLIKEYRYNSFEDSGPNNEIYLANLHSLTPGWQRPTDEKETNDNLPLWLGLWGWGDFQKLNKIDVDTDRLFVLRTKHIHPPDPYVVPIDLDFINGNSPFRGKLEVTASDKLNWHPKGAFQIQSITAICSGGPATIKLPPNTSAEAHVKMKFYFKLGGCAQPIKNIAKPGDQPDFPLPNNQYESNSLQSPETAIENYLYSFDWRRDFITKSATERMEKYTEPEITVVAPTGLHACNALPAPESEPTERTPEETEEEKKTLLQFFRLLRLKQRQYRQQIIRLMGDLE